MPKYKITEINKTGVVQSGAIVNTVYIPGRVVDIGEAIEPKLFTSLSQLKDSENSDKYDENALSFKLMKHLLSLGIYVLYEGVVEVNGAPVIDWERLQDKGLYDIRFLTMGEYDIVQSGMITCAQTRGDCTALMDHPESLTDYYSLLTSEPANWSTGWGVNYKDRVATKEVTYESLSDTYSTTPSFIAYKFYSRIINDTEEESDTYTQLVFAPQDWEDNWGNYYIVSNVSYVPVDVANAPEFATNTYYLPASSNHYVSKVRAYFESFKQDDMSFAAAFTPGFKTALETFGASAKDLVHIPGSFGYLFAYARAIKNNPEWYAIAGGQRGIIPELAKVEYEYTSAEIEMLQGRAKTTEVELGDDDDNVGCAINPIAYVRPFGYIIWGNRTFRENDAVKKTIATSFLNVRNLVSAVKKALYNASRKYTYEPNSDMLWVNFKSQIIPLLDQVKNGNGILGYKFVKLATTAKARLKARLIIIPIEAVEDFEIEIELNDSISTTEE